MLCRTRQLWIEPFRFFHATPAVSKIKKPPVKVHVNHEFHDIIKWVEPAKLKAWDPRRTGDLRPLDEVDPNTLKFEYQAFEEILNKLPEEYRQTFTVGYGHRRDRTKVVLQNMLDQTKRHKYDNKSLDFKVTWATWKIRNLQDLFLNYPRQKKSPWYRHSAKELVEKRRKWLNKMRHHDYKRFEWIIEILGVVYKHSPPFAKIQRRPAIDVLVNLHCNELREKKMAEYKAQLEEEKVPFLQMKMETLQAIRRDELSVGLTSSVDDDIIATRKLLLELEKGSVTIHPTNVSDASSESLNVSR